MKKWVRGVVAASIVVVMGTGAVYGAGGQTVSAQSGVSSVYFNGKRVSNPPKLVYGGTTYVQLYSIELALRQAEMEPSWDGTNFSFYSPPGAITVSKQQFESEFQNEWSKYMSISTSANDIGAMLSPTQPLSQTDMNSLATSISQIHSIEDTVMGWSTSTTAEGSVKTTFAELLDQEFLQLKFVQDAAIDVQTGDSSSYTTDMSAAVKVFTQESTTTTTLAQALYDFDPTTYSSPS